MIQGFVTGILILVGGVIALSIGRSYGAYDDPEEEWYKPWFRQVIFGPPGYRRVSWILFGGVLIVVDIGRVLYSLLMSR